MTDIYNHKKQTALKKRQKKISPKRDFSQAEKAVGYLFFS